MRLHVLLGGWIDSDKGAIFTPGSGDGERVMIPVPLYLVETDSGERVLIDTGMHPVHIDDPDHTFGGSRFAPWIRPRMTDADRLERRLEEIGLALGDITHVVNTHLHFDHAGQNHLFPTLPIVVQREAYAAAMEGRDHARSYYDRPELSYELVDGDVELLDGVTLLLAPGHVPGLQSVLLRGTGMAPILLAGDAISLRESLDTDNWQAFADPDAARASATRLCAVAEREGATMLFGHDVGLWHTLRHPPDFYGEPRGEVT